MKSSYGNSVSDQMLAHFLYYDFLLFRDQEIGVLVKEKLIDT